MKKLLLAAMCFLLVHASFAQTVAINTTGTTGDASSMLDVSSNTKGLLVPRMSTAQISSIASPAKGLLLYDSTVNQFKVNTGSAAAPNWQALTNSSSGWNLGGNTGVDPANSFIGTTDDAPLIMRIRNKQAARLDSASQNTLFGYRSGEITTAVGNSAIGYQTLLVNTSGSGNSVNGYRALWRNTTGPHNTVAGVEAMYKNVDGGFNVSNGGYSLYSNISGSQNVANGYDALYNNLADNNVACGFEALVHNTTGTANTATGASALALNTTASNNTGTGYFSLNRNSTGGNNTAQGAFALYSNSSGYGNTASGDSALYYNTSANYNTATGHMALNNNSSASYNTANGGFALFYNTTGNSNIASGYKALFINTTGNNNTAAGNSALYSNSFGSNNAAFGLNALFSNSSGSNNTAIGVNADVSAGNLNNATAIGYNAYVNASNKIRLGNSSVTVIEGQVPFTNPSDARFKYNIKQNVPGLAFIKKLKPVTYYFDEEKLDDYSRTGVIDGKDVHAASYVGEKLLHTGFLAQDVEKAAKELGYTFDGIHAPANDKDHYSLAYSQFIMPLVKGMQEQQQIIENQQAEIKKLNDKVDSLIKAIETFKSPGRKHK